MRHILIFAMSCFSVVTTKAIADNLTLANNGKCNYQIVLPNTYSDPGIAAWFDKTARLIQKAFENNGFNLPVLSEKDKDKIKPAIYLGNTQFARSNGFDVSKLASWAYISKVVGSNLIIAGKDIPSPEIHKEGVFMLGTVKGVTDFLRQYVGVRFLYPSSVLDSPAIEFLKTQEISVPCGLNELKIPTITYIAQGKETFYHIANNMFPPVNIKLRSHSWIQTVPANKYAKTHPEYFALVNGKRCCELEKWGVLHKEQYCLSNIEFQELIYQDALKWLDMGYETVAIGQPDGFCACQCEKCKTLYSTGDDWGEKLWLFNCKLAERLLKARPSKKVLFPAYMNTIFPPKSFDKLPDNVMVKLCGYSDNDFSKWSNKAPGGFATHVYNWGLYHIAGSYLPKRTPEYLDAQVRRFIRKNVRGIILDGFGELFGLEGPAYYIYGRMFETKEKLKAKDLLLEFYSAAFGKAADNMKNFYDTLHHGISLYSDYLDIQNIKCPVMSYKDIYCRRRKYVSDSMHSIAIIYTPKLLEGLENNLNRAEISAVSAKTKARLRLVRLEFDYLKSIAKVVHLYNAYKIQPDNYALTKVLDAVDDWHTLVNSYYIAGKMKPIEGWSDMIPFKGYGKSWLGLRKNHFLSRFKGTPFNWDRKAICNTSVKKLKTLNVALVNSLVSFDSSTAWNKAKPEILKLAGNGKMGIRALHDNKNMYLKIESNLPNNDKELIKSNTIDVVIAPSYDPGKYYRFTVSPDPKSKSDAANLLAVNPADPRYGHEDPTWTGSWDYESKITNSKRWIAFITLPFKTLAVDTPKVNEVWRVNFARTQYYQKGKSNISIWSTITGSVDVTNSNSFGEIVFSGQ